MKIVLFKKFDQILKEVSFKNKFKNYSKESEIEKYHQFFVLIKELFISYLLKYYKFNI